MDRKNVWGILAWLALTILFAAVVLALALAAPGPGAPADITKLANSLDSLGTGLIWTALPALAAGLGLAAWGFASLARQGRDLALALEQARKAGVPLPWPQGDDKNANPVAALHGLITELSARGQALGEARARAEGEARRSSEALEQVAHARQRAEASRCQGLLSAAATLGDAVAAIDAAAQDLHKSAATAASGADEQRRHTSDAASSMEQMNSAVAQVAHSAESASSYAQEATAKARAGAAAVERTVEAITSVNARTTALAETVQGLGQQAEAIGRVMTIISDIADQTNLLALNAAIEAARAGDAGRGFAVVADEVRKLAEKTMTATRDVGEQIRAIQSGVASTRDGMQDASRLVEEATAKARESGSTLEQIVHISGESASQVQSIAAASSQQSASSTHIAATIATVDRISGKTGESMNQALEAVTSLMDQVEELVHLNNVFKLIGGGAIQDIIGRLAASPDLRSMDPARQESALRRAVRENAMMELLYLTDASGVQPIGNVARPGTESPDDAKAKGKNWSARPWFKGAMDNMNLHISDIYQSQATGERCITVSTPFWDESGKLLGVLAADVAVRG